MAKPKLILAYSGGLDTSYCLVQLSQDWDVITVTTNTGGIAADELAEHEARALKLGAIEHRTIDGRHDVYQRFASYVIKGHVLRGGVYPLSVSMERSVQAEHCVTVARELGAKAIAHGSTGAGNDQIRFDMAIKVLAPELKIITPIRDQNLSREAEAALLAEKGVEIDPAVKTYSINASLWGTTIGGAETHDPWACPQQWDQVVEPSQAPGEGCEVELSFESGEVKALNGQAMDPIALMEALQAIGFQHGFGRGIHIGDTIIGIKGRIAFEAPAMLILVQAHRELEKIVTTQWQRHHKEHLASFYGKMLHEGQVYDPVMQDISAYIDSSQSRVSGDVRLSLRQGLLQVTGVRSPYSMMDDQTATYGENNLQLSGEDTRGFAQVAAVPAMLSQIKQPAQKKQS